MVWELDLAVLFRDKSGFINLGYGYQDDELREDVCRLRGSLSQVNSSLASLQYMTPENSNDRLPQSLRDKLIVQVFDNGSGGLPPYNSPFNATAEIDLLAIDENDAPVCVLPPYALVVQNDSSTISGSAILDVDISEYVPSTYKGLASASEVMEQ